MDARLASGPPPMPHPAEVPVLARARTRHPAAVKRPMAVPTRYWSTTSRPNSASSRTRARRSTPTRGCARRPRMGLGRPRHDRPSRRHRRDGDRHRSQSGPRALNDARRRPRPPAEDVTYQGVMRGRRLSGRTVSAWWDATSAAERRGARARSTRRVLPWGIGMRAPSFVTARLMETWAHGLDVRAALGAPPLDTDRLAHVAWLATRRCPTPTRSRAREPPPEPLRGRAHAAVRAPWTYGPDDAPDRITGTAGEYCRVFVQRLPATADTSLGRARATRPRRALEVARAYPLIAERRRPMPLFSFEGLTPQVHAGAFVAPTATLVGDVIVEEGASIWYGAVIRADYAPVIMRARRQRAGQRRDPRTARAHDRHRSGRDRRPQLRRARRDARSGVPGRERQRRARRRDDRRASALVAAGSVVAAGATIPAGMLAAGAPAS